MKLPTIRWLANSLIALVLGTCLCAFGPELLRSIGPKGSEGYTERMRVTSPDGQFDAVLALETYGGSVGGVVWYVSIVRKGKPAALHTPHTIFSAGKLDHEKLFWRQPHLLEIQYDVGDIDQFRNLWCSNEVENVGSYGERDFCVEIRLAPSSDSSVLTPAGEFRPAQ